MSRSLVWPSLIPSAAQQTDYSLTLQDEISHVAMDRGPPRLRNRFTSTKRQVTFDMIFTAEEFAVFKGFYDGSLAQGTREFIMPVWNGMTYMNSRVSFVEPYQSSDFGLDMNRVSLTLRVFEFESVVWEASIRFGGRGSFSIDGRSRPIHANARFAGAGNMMAAPKFPVFAQEQFAGRGAMTITTTGRRMANAQLPGGGVMNVNPSRPDPVTSAWAVAVQNNGGTTTVARRALINDFIIGLRTDGIFDVFDRIWITAAENAISARTELLAQTLATLGGAPTFTTDRGYTGVDASGSVFFDTNFNPSTQATKWLQNSGHVSVFSNTNAAASAGGGILIGDTVNGSPATITQLYPRKSDDTTNYGINTSGALSGGAPTPANSSGHYLIVRRSSSNASLFRNGVQIANATDQGSAPLPNQNFHVLGNVSDGVGGAGSALQVAAITFGSKFVSDADVTNFYNRLRTLLTAIGVP